MEYICIFHIDFDCDSEDNKLCPVNIYIILNMTSVLNSECLTQLCTDQFESCS